MRPLQRRVKPGITKTRNDMGDNELDELASKAGFVVNMMGQIVTPAPTEDARHPLRMFAELLGAAERERCARVAMEQTTHPEDPNNEVWQCAYNHVANQIADAIRKA